MMKPPRLKMPSRCLDLSKFDSYTNSSVKHVTQNLMRSCHASNSTILFNHFFPQFEHKSRKLSLNFCTTSSAVLVYLIFFLSISCTPGAAAIDCFKCVSLNGNNPSCEDPFHNNYSVSILESPCMGGRKGRNGLFPATACIKLAGRYYDTGETITVRGCALDSGTLNVDTEIIRMSHCGHFWFDERYVKGCLQSCDDADGCNGSTRLNTFSSTSFLYVYGVVLLLRLVTIIFPYSNSIGFYSTLHSSSGTVAL